MKDNVASASASRWLASLAMMAGTALSAPACPPEEGDSEGERGVILRLEPLVEMGQTPQFLRDLPVAFSFTKDEPEVTTTVTMSRSDGGNVYEVFVRNGMTTAKINGEDVPAKRVRNRHGTVELLGGSGEVVATFPGIGEGNKLSLSAFAGMGGPGVAEAVPPRRPGDSGEFLGFRDVSDPPVGFEPPPVMLGITMSEAADDEGNGVVIDKVMDGFPASEGGVKSGDKVLAIDGEEVDGVEPFREYLRTRKGGDEVTLKVLRDGKAQELKIKLRAFDVEAMKPLIAEMEAARASSMIASHEDERLSEASTVIAAAREALAKADISDEVRASALARLEKAVKLAQAAKEKSAAAEGMFPRGLGMTRSWSNDKRPEVYVGPAARAEGALSTERMDALDGRLEKLAARMDKALEAMEAQQGRNEKLERENAELKKKIEELQRKAGGN